MSIETLKLCKAVAERSAGIIEEFMPEHFDDSEMKRTHIQMATLCLDDCHRKYPLRLQEMLETEDKGSVVHDVNGIMKYWNPTAKKLEQGFMPRYASAS